MREQDFDARLALRAPPMLRAFNAAAVLSAADVHVARRLGALCGEPDERVLLAVALAVRGVRGGSVCVELADAAATAPDRDDVPTDDGLPWPDPAGWRRACLHSPLVAVGTSAETDDPGGARPLRWVDGRLYLDRYWRHEQVVREQVTRRLAGPAAAVDHDVLAAAVHRLFPRAADHRQRLATAACALGRLTVLTGGPGTGKTTTVARLVAVLQQVAGPGLRVALAAPTGKAAARLQQAVAAELGLLTDSEQRGVATPAATTVHRLLGWRPGSSTRFRHDARHHLPHDLVVVDETSMVSLPLMARLLEALRPQARLLLVGDPDQLASVEAGAVLGDLVARPARPGAVVAAVRAALPGDVPSPGDPDDAALDAGVVRLLTVHRHGAEIADLATAVRQGRADEALDLLHRGGDAVGFTAQQGDLPGPDALAAVRRDAVSAGVAAVEAARRGDVAAALQALESHRVLLAHRRGPAGVGTWAARVEAWVAAAAGVTSDEGPWYRGRPLLVTSNDRDTGLSNGDTGVVVADGSGGVVAAFGDPRAPLLVRPHRLPAVQTVHAMTVHRGQGSQFTAVSLVLPPASSPLLTRELLYTALTRATQRVRVVGSEAAVRAAVGRPIRRASGLRHP